MRLSQKVYACAEEGFTVRFSVVVISGAYLIPVYVVFSGKSPTSVVVPPI